MKLNNGEYSFYPEPGRTKFILRRTHTCYGARTVEVCLLLFLVVICFANFSLYCINIYCNSISQAIEMPFAPLIQCNTCQRRLGPGFDFSTASFFYSSSDFWLLASGFRLTHTPPFRLYHKPGREPWNLKNEVVLKFLCVYKHSNSFICHTLPHSS